MPRELLLIVYTVPRGRAHWGLFVPHTSEPTAGKIIHAVGSPMHGFKLEFLRNYSLSKTRREPGLYLLGAVDDNLIVDGYVLTPNAGSVRDQQPVDNVEVHAAAIPTPGIAPEELWPKGANIVSGWAEDIEGVERCQEWTRKLVEALIEARILGRSAIAVLDAAPRR